MTVRRCCDGARSDESLNFARAAAPDRLLLQLLEAALRRRSIEQVAGKALERFLLERAEG